MCHVFRYIEIRSDGVLGSVRYWEIRVILQFEVGLDLTVKIQGKVVNLLKKLSTTP
jgi:hypothetical protein